MEGSEEERNFENYQLLAQKKYSMAFWHLQLIQGKNSFNGEATKEESQQAVMERQ